MSKGILGLEISSNRLRYSYLKREAGRILLSRWGEFFFEEDPVKEPTVFTNALQEIIQKEKFSPSKLFLTISGKNVFTHTIELPPMSSEELRGVLTTEIEKIPTFSDKDFDFIYSTYSLSEERMRVLFGAVTKETLESYIQAVTQTKIYLESLELSPLNLLGWGLQVEGDEHEVLLILNESYSQIIISSQNKCELFYTIPIGRLDIFPSEKKISNLVFLNWTDEIKRIFRSYLRQVQKEDIENLTFIWDNRDGQELDKLLKKELDLQISQPNLEKFSMELVDKEREFNPIFFLSLASPLRFLKKLKSKFFFGDFLEELKVKETIKKTIKVVLIVILFAGSLLGIIAMNFRFARSKIIKEDKKIVEKIADLEKRTAEFRRKKDDFLEVKDRLISQATLVRRLNRVVTTEILGRIGSVLPSDTVLTAFEFSESGQINLKGLTFKIDSLSEFIRQIKETGYFEEVKFNFLREREIEEERFVEFDISTRLKEFK